MLCRLGRGLALLLILPAVSCGFKGGGGSGDEALISADTRTGVAPLTVNFSAPSEQAGSVIILYQWDFGDPLSGSNNSSFLQIASHTYNAPGTYTVSLTITTGNGNSTATEPDFITVTEPETTPTAFFSADITSGDAPLLVRFTDQSIAGTAPIESWLWNFGDPASGSANTRTEQNPSHIFNAPGAYTVSLTVTTRNGSDTETQVDFITAQGPSVPPVADFTADTTSGDVPLSVAFTDQSLQGSSPITSWLWNFGDPASGAANVSIAQNPSHTYNEIGAYTVALTVTTADGNAAITKPSFITASSPLPIAEFTADTTSGKPPVTVAFTDQSLPGASPITSWLWNFGDPASGAEDASTAQNPSHTYNDAGTYSVSLMVTTTEGSDTINKAGFITAAVRVTGIASTSPILGEDGVAVTRETVLRFENPLMPASVTASAIFAEYGGQTLGARLHLSPDAKTASLFYDQDLPANARIRVIIDGELLIDDEGELVDADANGTLGGVGVLEFDTLSITPIQGTAVIGRVFASELATTLRGHSVSMPLQGATISVDGTGGAVSTETDALGNFRLDPAPAGRFFVHIDGRTATNLSIPVGAYYPFVGKAWEAVAGAETVVGDVFLPLIVADTLQTVSATSPTTIVFPDAVLAAHPELSGVQIVVPADSLFSDDGTRGGAVGIAPVRPDRLPGQLPPGLNFPIVITVQTNGPTNFDVPVPVRFPNLPDPMTNAVLPPGSKTALWSFNHDMGRFEVVGPGTVSNDAQFINSDPGFGILAPGWHAFNPGTSATGGGGRANGPGDVPDECKTEAELLITEAEQCAEALAVIPVEVVADVGCGLSSTLAWQQALIDCTIDPDGCSRSFLETTIEALLGCIPEIGGVASASFSCMLQLNSAQTGLLTCQTAAGPGETPPNIYGQQIMVLLRAYEVYANFFGSTIWVDFESDEAAAMLGFYAELQSAFDPAGDDGEIVTPAERNALLALPRAASISTADVDALILRWSTFLQGDLTDLDIEALSTSVDLLADVFVELEASGWITTLDGFTRASNVTANLIGSLVQSNGGVSQAPFYFKVTNLSTGSVQRGRLSALGSINTLTLATDTKYIIHYLHPTTLESGSVVIFSASAGQATQIPATYLFIEAGVDADADGLTDKNEDVIGSNPLNPDTDGDGIEDGVELQQGTDPLDALDAATGIIATAHTPGTALDVHATDEMILVADGLEGIALFNAYMGMNPIIIAQVDTPGLAQAVAYSNGVAAVADGDEGLAIIDLSDPANPFIIAQIPASALGGSPHAVAMRGDSIFAATPTGILTLVDSSGTLLDSADLVDRIEDIAIKGRHLYAATSSGSGNFFNVLLLDASPLTTASSTILSIAPPPMGVDHRWRLFLGETIAYLTTLTEYVTLNISDPLNPFVIKENSSSGLSGFRHTVTTGTGLGIVAAGPDASDPAQPSDISLYDTSDPTVTTTLLETFTTPGIARAVNLLNGLAYVADQEEGLQVINYLPYDAFGIPPAISLSTDAGGTSLLPGTSLLVVATATDDVQVRNVELLVDGVSTQVDGNFPYEFIFPVPLRSEATALSLAVAATDTGGNRTETSAQNFTIVEDLTPPALMSTNPAHQTIGFDVSVVRLSFDEALDPAALTLSGFTLTDLGIDGLLGGGDDTPIPIASIVLPDPKTVGIFPDILDTLAAGFYELEVSPSVISDVSGNFMTTGFSITFAAEVAPAVGVQPWISLLDGFWQEPSNWFGGSLPNSADDIVIDVPGGDITVFVERTGGTDDVFVNNLRVEENIVLTDTVSFNILGVADFNASLIVEPGSTLFALGPDAFVTLNGPVTVDNAAVAVGEISPGGGAGTLFIPGLVTAIGTTFNASGGGTLSAPSLTSLTGGEIILSQTGTLFDVPALTNIDDTRVLMTDGAVLDLSLVTSYTISVFIDTFFDLQSGAGTSLDLSGLLNLTLNVPGGTPPAMNIFALQGASATGSTINLSSLTTILHQEANPLTFRADGGTSLINLISLTTFDAGLVTFTEQNGAVIQLPPRRSADDRF